MGYKLARSYFHLLTSSVEQIVHYCTIGPTSVCSRLLKLLVILHHLVYLTKSTVSSVTVKTLVSMQERFPETGILPLWA